VSIADIPEWNYDGSSTYQATTESSEVILKPVYYFPDPFRGGDNIMVLCEAFSWTDGSFKELKPCNTNFRNFAKKIFDHKPEEQPWFGIEQEYILLQ
jgi:glutamine synthetase